MRKNRGYKKGEPFRDARLFVVACEGEKREKDYFERLGHGSQRLKVRVLAPEPSESLSAPKWVLDRVVHFIEKEGVNTETGDQIWLVMDVDRWKTDQLHDLAAHCKEKGWGLSLSNPCFEIWLLLHVKDSLDVNSFSCQDFKRDLGNAVRGGYKVEKFLELVPEAIARCQLLDLDQESPIPAKRTSRVHLVVSQMLQYF
jgi:hypothetical protein